MSLTNHEKYTKWASAAWEDILTAEAMLQSRRLSYVAFLCQQSMEKLAKGLHVLHIGQEAPYTHKINIVLKDIGAVASADEYNEYKVFFNELTAYYIVGRYDVYKQQIAQDLTAAECEAMIEKTKEAFSWLQSHVKQ